MNITPPAPPAGHRWLRSRASAVVAAALVGLLLASTTWLLGREFERGARLQDEVRQSYERRAELLSMLSLHQDIETGQRGYLLTADRRFLEPYLRARSRIRSEIATLDAAARGSPSLRPPVARLKALSAAKIRFAERTIALKARGDGAAALALVAAGTGKQTMDAMRATIAAADGAEHARLDRRIALARAADRQAQQTSAILQLFLVLLLAAAAFIVQRSLAQRKLALHSLRSANARQAAIFDSARDGIIVVNASGSIESLNPAAARMYGYDAAELVRRDVGLLFEVAPDQGRVETFLKRLQRRSGHAGLSQEFWGRRRDGATFPGEVALAPVEIPGGPRFVAIVRDISERKQVDRMKTEFVSTVSHELRTPLTSIAGSLGLLAGGAVGNLPGPAARLVEIARSNCERLVRLISDMLDIEKIEAGQMHFAIAPVKLAPLLAQTVEANLGFAARHGVRLLLGPVDEAATVMADSDGLAQVVTNLVSNGVKFSPKGKVVRIDVARLDRHFRIKVSDRGSGIPEAFRERIFAKFVQADSTDTRRNGGTGLGLSIVREIVSRFGGTVGFDDRAGGGTVFHVDIPAAAAPAGAEAARDEADQAAPSILHVEDDPDVLRVTADAFGRRARLRAATTLAAARDAIARGGIDAIILDVALPDGSGLDLLAELRRSAAPPVLLYSAEEVEPSQALGAAAVLVKSRASLDRLVDATLALASRGRKEAA